MIVPRHVIAGSGQTAPSDKVNVAGIGVGGQGESDINEISKESNIVALCDVDSRRAANTFKKFPDTKQYRDFRKMLDEQSKNIGEIADSATALTDVSARIAQLVSTFKLGDS